MASIHTPSENVRTVHSLAGAITAATTNGASADCLGHESAKAIVYAAPTGAGTTSDFKLQESSDNTSWSDVPGGAFTQITTAGGAKLYVMNVDLSKRSRYVRLVHTGAGGSAGGTFYGLLELYNARYRPVAQANAAFSV
jgi:hypothetical protein